MPRLFTKFAQADPSYHRRHRGTGLGLAISRVLVENMGGTIRITSEGTGRGTSVHLAFPAPVGAADLSEKPACAS
jgi:signal transduction histidine kinase